MTITSILITPEGIAKGENPEWKFPTTIPNDMSLLEKQSIEATEHAIEFNKGIITQQQVWKQLPLSAFNTLSFIPGLYAVDPLEVEVVAQLKTVSGQWVDTYGGVIPECELEDPMFEYRKVLRITEKSK